MQRWEAPNLSAILPRSCISQEITEGRCHEPLANNLGFLCDIDHHSLDYFGQKLNSPSHINGQRTSHPELRVMHVKLFCMQVVDLLDSQVCDTHLGVASGKIRDAEILVRNPSPRLFDKKFRDSKKVKTNHAKTRL